MGACTFETFGAGKDFQDAYKNAVEAALYEHGHDSYNGTISTTSNPKNKTDEFPRYGTKACRTKIEKSLDTDAMSKWECWGIEITGKALKEYRKRHGLERKRIKVFLFFGWAGC